MPKTHAPAPERVAYTKYYEHDGALRAYSNRMLWFGITASGIAFVLALLFFWQRVQPPTIIRIAANGEATVIGGATRAPGPPIGLISALAAGTTRHPFSGRGQTANPRSWEAPQGPQARRSG